MHMCSYTTGPERLISLQPIFILDLSFTFYIYPCIHEGCCQKYGQGLMINSRGLVAPYWTGNHVQPRKVELKMDSLFAAPCYLLSSTDTNVCIGYRFFYLWVKATCKRHIFNPFVQVLKLFQIGWFTPQRKPLTNRMMFNVKSICTNCHSFCRISTRQVSFFLV